MKLLLLAEGDAERWDSWSGTTKSVVDHLRAARHDVATVDVDLYGADRWLSAARAFSPNRKRWGVRYHLEDPAYRARSRKAARAIAAYPGRPDCILQIGATFEPDQRGNLPYALFCDSNIQMSMEGAKYGVSDAVWLRPAEFDAIRRREARLYRDACVVLTISEYLRRSFIDHFDVPPDRVCVVGAGPNLDLGRIPEPPAPRQNQPPTVLFVGKQFERKGGALLLEAFRALRARFGSARLVIVGPPVPPASEPGVEWLGNLDKNRPEEWARLVAAYQDADVFCLPTLFEPFGIVILEAMFFGLPCVGTAAWAIPEMIADGETGYTVPRDDAGALTDRLARLLGDRPRARQMGLAGRRRAEERFSWPVVVGRMGARLERCLRPVSA
jgi:glycosyltransferase involved in cell wall biosynthesis